MSAGIVSACLPTLKPALQFFVRKLGIKGSIFDLFPSEQSTSHTNHTEDQNTATGGGRGPERNGSQGPFYRLQDGTQKPIDTKLRPDHTYDYTVSKVPGDKDGLSYVSGDEVPPHSIHVSQAFTQERD